MGKKTSSSIGVLLESASKLVSNKGVQKVLFGTYADDTPRSLVDGINGEILSPKQRKKFVYKKKKKKKHKKCKIKI